MKFIFQLVFLFYSFFTVSQIPLYDYKDYEQSLLVPKKINSERSVVIVHVPDETGTFRIVGDWKKLANSAHSALVTMGIDVVMYVNHYDLVTSENSREAYTSLFNQRNIHNIIFLSQKNDGYELLMSPYNKDASFFKNGESVFFMQRPFLRDLLLETGKEIKRADFAKNNFLIPSSPNFISGISIVEKSLLKNYPGILRRSKLSVERFAELAVPANASNELIDKIEEYNQGIRNKNLELQQILSQYPYEYELIDPLSDQDLLRQRRQFVLRSITGQSSTLREMLDYKVSPNETDFISTIPIMPDQTRAKPLPASALVTKFYVKQNISKNIHVGEWDADTTWQDALRNMIGNLIQEHNLDK